MKLLRTIRLDPSDTLVFERAAEPGEWAVPGTFVFAPVHVGGIEGKVRVAFRSGFLGIESLGWSTLVQVVEASAQDHCAAVDLLARRLVEHFGAPDLEVARTAAAEEVAFAASLSNHPEGTVVALARRHEDGDIRETFRTLSPGAVTIPERVFAFVADAEGEEEEAPLEEIDLLGLAKERARE
ncbi:MAG TPA: DUF6505 family protein [Hyphomicrobiaceae bacterium]